MNVEQKFQEFVAYALDKKLPLEGIAVADENQVIAEHHFVPDMARDIYSHTKSYMATAAGIAIEEGKLSLDDKVAEMFPEKIPKDVDERLGKITLRHLLTMSSGFNRAYLMRQDRRSGVGAPDYLAYMFSRKVEVEPGSCFAYSSADSILAGRMIEKAVGKNLGEYMYERIFRPLGQGWPIWEADPQGHFVCGSGIRMKLTEMMKLGQLYLADGVWKGERIVSGAWVKEATKKQIEIEANGDIWRVGYGYQFWLSPYPDSYRADGAYGQVTTVLPQKGLVVAIQCPEIGDFEAVKQALHAEFLTQL